MPDLEADIAATEAKVSSLEAALQSPDVYRDAPRLRQTTTDLGAAKDALALAHQTLAELLPQGLATSVMRLVYGV